MRRCANCNMEIPYLVKIGGKELDCRHRKYCLNCNPAYGRKFWRGILVNPDNYINGKRIRNLTKTHFLCKTCGKMRYQKSNNKECSTCRSTKARNLHKLQAIEYLGSKCSVCGYNKTTKALGFHHKNPKDKKFTLSNHWDRTLNVLKPELDKCILVCANCHAEIEAAKIEKQTNIKLPTLSA